jgi:hypothetical protein
LALIAAAAVAGVWTSGASAGEIPAAGLGWSSTPSGNAFTRDRLPLAFAMRQPPPTQPEPRTLLRRQRPNTISLGLQGSYGVVRGTSRLADGFSDGFGYGLRFRYMLSPSFALGFSFENQHYDNRGGAPSTTPGASDSSIVMTTVSVEGVVFLHREREVNPYFLGGFGHAAPDVVDKVLGSSRVNEGMFLVLGAGLERFLRPRFSLDFTARGYGMISNSEFTSFAQICAGIHLYPGD